MPKQRYKFFILLLLVLLAGIWQVQIKTTWGWTVDAVLAILVTVLPFVSLPELLVLLGEGYWLINWQPVPGKELLIITAILLGLWLGQRKMPWQWWLSTVVLVALAVGIFYFLLDARTARAELAVLLWDVLWSGVLSLGIFGVLRHLYLPRRFTIS